MELSESAKKGLYPYVRMVLCAPKDGELYFIGSGFLLSEKNRTYLITAAHVLDNHSETNQLFIDNLEGKLVRILGDSIVSNSSEHRRSDDQKDFAIIALNAVASGKLKKTMKLKLDQFDLSYKHNYKYGYIAIGYPISRNKGNIIQTQSEAIPYMVSNLEANIDTYEKLGLTQAEHIVIDFESKDVYSEKNEKRHAWSLRGLSGCPVWGVLPTGKCKVVSILTAHHQKNINAIVTTKIGTNLKKWFCYRDRNGHH